MKITRDVYEYLKPTGPRIIRQWVRRPSRPPARIGAGCVLFWLTVSTAIGVAVYYFKQ